MLVLSYWKQVFYTVANDLEELIIVFRKNTLLSKKNSTKIILSLKIWNFIFGTHISGQCTYTLYQPKQNNILQLDTRFLQNYTTCHDFSM